MPKAKKQVLFEVGSPSLKKTKQKKKEKAVMGYPSQDPFGRGTANGKKPGFPDNQVVTLRYSECSSLPSGSLNAAKWQFCANGLYDPDLTFTGHQPSGYDQWTLLYNHYVVEKCVITVAPKCNYLTSHGNTVYGLYVSDDVTIPTQASALVELGSAVAIGSYYQDSPTLCQTIDMRKFFSRNAIASDPDLRCPVTANPTEKCVVSLWAQDPAKAIVRDVDFVITLDYTVRFMEPIDVGSSMSLLRAQARTQRITPPEPTTEAPQKWVRI